MSNTIPVLRPTIDQATKDDLLAVLDSGWWGQGPKVAQLEAEFAALVGAKYAVATNSCTAALDLAIKAWPASLAGGFLVTTPLTFVADAIVGEWNQLNVEFSDIAPDSLCLAPDRWPAKVIVAVNSHGRLADIPRMRELNPEAFIIEDCAHALLTAQAGQRGDVAVWSFQAVKTIPAGDGGMVTTNDEALAKTIKNMTWLGIEKSTYARSTGTKYSWDYDIVHSGTKSYMNDLTAVIVLGQLRRLPEILAKRQFIQAKYNDALAGTRIAAPAWSETCQYYTMQLDRRDAMSEALARQGIATSVHFKPLSEMTYWKRSKTRPLPVTERVWPRLLSLPCHDALTDDEQAYIITAVKDNL